jgi:ubiquinone/menaquinone biosynthesis C-methylase UbiE
MTEGNEIRENPTYNTIGKTYDTTRKADLEIIKLLTEYLSPKPNGKYLDIACGSGNYTTALHKQNIDICGIEISEEMLSKARKKSPDISWYQGDAKKLPAENNSFDGAICTLATHHIKNIKQAYLEAFRVIKKGKFVIFTATPEQMKQYWLWEYFPKMMENGSAVMHRFSEHEDALKNAGFTNITKKPFFVTNNLQDWFLQSGKYRPEVYLDENVRAGISSFHLSTNENEINLGLAKLKNDIESGNIKKIIDEYESSVGDYCFIVGEKL